MSGRKANPKTGLTPGDCAFLEAYFRLKSAHGAYSETHPAANDMTARAGAKAILAKPAVIAAIARVQGQAQLASGVTLADHLRILGVLRNGAVNAGEWRAAIYAEELRGKASGHYKTEVHVHAKLTHEMVQAIDFNNFSDDELAQVAAGDITDELFARLKVAARGGAIHSSSQAEDAGSAPT